MNIAAILSRQAGERGDWPALIGTHRGRDRVVSFRVLESAAARLAGRLERDGIRAGDNVLILHPMSADLYAFLIALFRIGAVGIFLDPSAGREYVERCLRIASPRAFFGSAKAHVLRLWIPALRRIPLAYCSAWAPGAARVTIDADGTEKALIAPADDNTPALITFTSGSTGAPKAALRTHGFLLAQHRVLQASLEHRAGTMDLTTLPVFVLANLASGVTSVLPDADMRRPGRIAPRPVLRQLERLPIATMAASPAFVSRLATECRNGNIRIEGLKKVFMGGAPVFPEDMRQARDAFPHAEITAVYGSTEAEPMAEIALSSISEQDFDDMAQGRGLLAGRPVDAIDLRIVQSDRSAKGALDDQTFRGLLVDSEEVGEIVVSGDHVLSGYLHGVGDEETKFQVDGKLWHRTGDLGWMDRMGRLWLMGRAAAVIEDDRGVLYPFAVECAARQIEGIRQAAVVAVHGHRILAVEVHSPGSAVSLRKTLAWARLDDVCCMRAIPVDKRHNAKVDYVRLARTLSTRE